jgi:hypothetical protein
MKNFNYIEKYIFQNITFKPGKAAKEKSCPTSKTQQGKINKEAEDISELTISACRRYAKF